MHVHSNTSCIVSGVVKEDVVKFPYTVHCLLITFMLKLICAYAWQAIVSCYLCVLTNISYRSS